MTFVFDEHNYSHSTGHEGEVAQLYNINSNLFKDTLLVFLPPYIVGID